MRSRNKIKGKKIFDFYTPSYIFIGQYIRCLNFLYARL